MDIVEEVKKFVENECKKPTSKYGYGPFLNHFIPMRDYAIRLAQERGADLEIVELASWLHDIGSIIYGRENHHLTSAGVADKKLRAFGYPNDKVEQVKHCILSHRGSMKGNGKTLESEIIIEADALSCFDHIEGQFYAAFVSEGKSQEEAKISVREKLTNKWNQLSKEGKKLVKLKYKAAMILFT